MTEEITNADSSRNWEANILLDNVKRLEFELKVTKADYEASEQENAELKEKNAALEETLQTIEQLKDEDSLRIAQLVTENAKLKNERTADLVKQIDELKEENERLNRCMMEALHHEGNALRETIKYKQTLQEIKAIAEEGLQSICYKANCATCRCYSKKILNDTLENIINNYFNEDGDFTDTEGDFFEVLQAFIDRERVACNKAQPISEKILDLITKAESEG